MPETVETTPEQPVIAQKPRYRRISESDVDDMAELASKRVNEKDSCHFLGINYDTWLKWKCKAKNESRFTKVLARVRTAKIEANWKNVENAGKKDWRASREMLSLLNPETYSERHNGPAVNVQVGIFANSDLDALGAKVYSQPRQAQGKDVKQLQDKPRE